jgi:hypothetical protein
MKGIVLGYDTRSRLTILRGEDGRRYGFAPADWRDQRAPRKRDVVDFEPDGHRARDVFMLESANGTPPPTAAAPAAALSAWPVTRVLVERPAMAASLLVLLAGLTGAYAVGDLRISLIEAPELIARMSEALDSLVAVSGADPSPRLGAGAARVLLVLLLGLYLVPLLAAITLWREFVGRPDMRLARLAGLAAMILPVGLPLLVILVVQIWVLPGLPDLAARLGRAGVTTPQQVFEVLRVYSTGTVLVFAAGALLWSAANGRAMLPRFLRRPAGEDEPAAAAPADTGTAELFAPVGPRAYPPRPSPAPDVAASWPNPRPAAPSQAPREPAPTSPAPPHPAPSGPVAEPAATARPAPPPGSDERFAAAPGAAPPPAPDRAPLDAMGLLAEDIRAALSRREPGHVASGPYRTTPLPDSRAGHDPQLEVRGPQVQDQHGFAPGGQAPALGEPSVPVRAEPLPPRSASVWPSSLAAGLARADLVAGPHEEAGEAQSDGAQERGEPAGLRRDQSL